MIRERFRTVVARVSVARVSAAHPGLFRDMRKAHWIKKANPAYELQRVPDADSVRKHGLKSTFRQAI